MEATVNIRRSRSNLPQSGSARTRLLRLLGPFTVRSLAARIGISPPYLSRLLAGKRRMLMQTAMKLATARGISLDELNGLLAAPAHIAIGSGGGRQKPKRKPTARR